MRFQCSIVKYLKSTSTMSLFGSSPDDSSLSTAPTRDQKSSLFDDEQRPSTKSGNSLFDDQGANGDSPWSMPTPKRASKGELVKTLLPASDVPESYIDAFDILGASGYKVDGGKIGIAGVKKLFEGSSVDASNQDRIIKLVTGEQAHALGRSEFNVLLALIGLSEEREEASLDSVDERRKSELSLQCKLTPSAKAPGCRSSRAIVTLS